MAVKKRINLALQGGGAHGAFTWGVLERLLKDKRIEIDGISGTSAGAINAVVLADGLEKGGREQACKSLEKFWRTVSENSCFSPYNSGYLSQFGVNLAPVHLWLDAVSLVMSPYQLNPLNINPLRDLIKSAVDFDSLKKCDSVRLFISATNVRTNRLRIFTNPDLTLDVVMASTCIPQIHQAVEIEGDPYWDGGFMGNPVLEPLVERCDAGDLLIVQLNPTLHEQTPRTAQEINDRMNEITFNATLMREMRSIAVITRLIDDDEIHDPRFHRVWFHLISAEEALAGLGIRSKYDTGWPFLNRLREAGFHKTDLWLKDNYRYLGKRSTIDLSEWAPAYLNGANVSNLDEGEAA